MYLGGSSGSAQGPRRRGQPRGDDRPAEQVAGMRGHTDVAGEFDALTGCDGGDQVAEAPRPRDGSKQGQRVARPGWMMVVEAAAPPLPSGLRWRQQRTMDALLPSEKIGV